MTITQHKTPWLCGLALLVAQTGGALPTQPVCMTSAVAQETTGELTKRQQYEMALQQLDKIKFAPDDPTSAKLPAIREILRRWAEGEELGEVEYEVVTACGLGGRGGGGGSPLPTLEQLKKNISKAGADVSSKAATFEFEESKSERRRVERGLVNMRVKTPSGAKGSPTVVVVILSSAGGATPLQRAHTIAERMRSLSKTCPTWWSQMIISQKPEGKGEPLYFVATKQNPTVPLVTTDPAFARESGIAPPELAKRLIKSMHDNIADVSSRSVTDPSTPEEKRWVAFTTLQAADKAFDNKDLGSAETYYKQAIEMDAAYLTPYLGLAELYLAQNDVRSARDLLSTALKLPKLSTEDKQDIKKMQTRCK